MLPETPSVYAAACEQAVWLPFRRSSATIRSNRRCFLRRTASCNIRALRPGMNSGKTSALFTLRPIGHCEIRDRATLSRHPAKQTAALRRKYDGVVSAPAAAAVAGRTIGADGDRRSTLNRHLLQVGVLEVRNPMAVRRKERPAHVRNAPQRHRIVAIELADVQLELCRAGHIGETASVLRDGDVGGEGIDRQRQVATRSGLQSHGASRAGLRAVEQQH